MEDSDLSAIENACKLLNNESFSKPLCELTLPGLNAVVIKSSQDESYRQTLASSEEVWRLMLKCADLSQNLEHICSNAELRYLYMRTLRGVVLLARNLSVSNQELPQTLLLGDKFVKSFNYLTRSPKFDEMEIALYGMLCEFLFNVSRTSITYDKSSFNDIIIFLQYPINMPDKGPIVTHYSLYFRNLSSCDEFVYSFLKNESVSTVLYHFIIQDILPEHTELAAVMQNQSNDLDSLSTLAAILVSTFAHIVCHESFNPFLQHLESTDDAMFLEFLKIAQLVITSSSAWDKFQLTGIMAWCFRIFESTANSIEKYFEVSSESEKVANLLHDKLIIVLDIISTLSQFEHVRKFMHFYKGIEALVKLLHTFQQHLLRLNIHKSNSGIVKDIKATNSKGEKISDMSLLQNRVEYETGRIKSTNFPECKILIIETLGFLTYQNKDIQDKLRHLHALELVLSNCVIDDNDPFIKERSIMCLKFLLHENPENQAFVAQMEAKHAVQDETLAAAGYEVNIGAGGK